MQLTAPELAVARWFNAPETLSLSALRGKLVVLHAFQMLCPGCVAHALPQAQKLHRLTQDRADVAVIGLHSVFEHHAAMTPVALEAFIHEYRLTFPIAVDLPTVGSPIPQTMHRYGMRGTPSTVVIDQAGRIVDHRLGPIDDLALGLLLGSLVTNAATAEAHESGNGCLDGFCATPAGPRR